MGCWGTKPFENDSAADWFGDLWDEFPVPGRVEETLGLDLHDCNEEIRAAAHVLIAFGRTYTWPVDDIDRQCDLAVRRLQEIKKMDIYADDEFQLEIQKEIDELSSRISDKYKRENLGK
ncbi:MAG TPA: DUF4259 domain-containing protein [Planctomycetota bacterium]|jgi:hypothetical protein